MKILTVSASPYLLVRNGRMNAAVIEKLIEEGHEVSTASWHHDEGFFLPEEGGAHWYEKNGEKLAVIYPMEIGPQSSGTIYELMKKVQPDIVISIGDYKETDFIWEVKAMIPNLFKWISILTIDCLPINENHKQQLEYSDSIVSISDFGDKALKDLLNAEIIKINFGPDELFFEKNEIKRNISFMCSAKNAQASNIGAFIKSMSEVPEAKGYLHTNLYDPGDYDIDLLIDRYNASNVSLPDKYISVKESIPDEDMRDEYKSHCFFVETSVKGASCLSMLESMACGCIPIGIMSGRSGEILNHFNDPSFLSVDYENYIGANEEEFSVISMGGLSSRIAELNKWAIKEPDKLKALSEESAKIARLYSKNSFTNSVSDLVKRTKLSKTQIAVDSF